jgi:hypothetical protein
LVLQDFGVISREDIRRGLLTGVRAEDLLRTLEEYLSSLTGIGARALLIVDEAQKLPSTCSPGEALTQLTSIPLQVVRRAAGLESATARPHAADQRVTIDIFRLKRQRHGLCPSPS